MGFSCFYGAEKVLNFDCHLSGNPEFTTVTDIS